MTIKSKEEVAAVLVALGNSKDKVATKLLELGMRGERRSCSRCPVARYLMATIGEERYIMSVSGSLDKKGLFVGAYNSLEDQARYEFSFEESPEYQAIFDFIAAFDQEGYGELDFNAP